MQSQLKKTRKIRFQSQESQDQKDVKKSYEDDYEPYSQNEYSAQENKFKNVNLLKRKNTKPLFPHFSQEERQFFKSQIDNKLGMEIEKRKKSADQVKATRILLIQNVKAAQNIVDKSNKDLSVSIQVKQDNHFDKQIEKIDIHPKKESDNQKPLQIQSKIINQQENVNANYNNNQIINNKEMSLSEQNDTALSPSRRQKQQHSLSQQPMMNTITNFTENNKDMRQLTQSQIQENQQKLKMLEMIKKRKEQLIEQSNYFENNSVQSQIPDGKYSKQSELSIFNQGFNKESQDKTQSRQAHQNNFRIVNENQIEFVNLKKSTPGREYIISSTQRSSPRLQDDFNSARQLITKPLNNIQEVEHQDIMYDQNKSIVNDENSSKLSYKALIKNIESKRPTDFQTKQQFKFNSKVVTKNFILKMFLPCLIFKKNEKGENEEDSDEEIEEEVSIQIGEGATLYLQMLYGLAVIFLILTIINGPVYFVFIANAAAPTISGFHEFFTFFTLANIGQSSFGCSYSQISVDFSQFLSNQQSNCQQSSSNATISVPKLFLSCQGGTITQINEIGFMNSDDYLRANPVNPDNVCKNIQNPVFMPQTSNLFTDNSTYRSSLYLQNQQLLGYQSSKNNPFNVDNSCQYYTMFGSNQQTPNSISNFMSKNCLGQKSCYIDPINDIPFVQALSCACKSQIQNNLTSNYLMMAYQCSSDTITILNNYTGPTNQVLPLQFSRTNFLWWYVIIDIGGVLLIIYFLGNLSIINQKRLQEMQRHLIEAKDYSVQINNLKVDKFSQDPRILKMKIWLQLDDHLNCIKIENQSTQDQSEAIQIIDINLSMISQYQAQKLVQMQNIKKQIDSKFPKDMQTLWNEDYQKQIQKLQDLGEDLKSSFKNIQQNNQIVKTLRVQQRIKSIESVFITLCQRSDADLILKNTQQNILNQSVRIEQAIDPDQVLWKSNFINLYQRKIREVLFIICWIILALGAIVLNIYLVYLQKSLEIKYKIVETTECPNVTTFYNQIDFTQQTVQIYLQQLSNTYNLFNYAYSTNLGCFCIYFSQFSSGSAPICNQYYINISLHLFAKFSYPALAIILNWIIQILFQKLIKIQNLKSTQIESYTQFIFIVVYEIISLTFIYIVSTCTLFAFPDVKDQVFYGFNSVWYNRIGSSICTIAVFLVGSTNLYDWTYFSFKQIQRFIYRKGKLNIKASEQVNDDKVNSLLISQNYLNQLYQGAKFDIEKSYARMVAITFMSLTYSTGMPILYPIVFLFLMFTFLTKKYMILNHYKRQKRVKDEIAKASIVIIYFGLIVHIIVGIFTMTNKYLQTNLLNINLNNINSIRFAYVDYYQLGLVNYVQNEFFTRMISNSSYVYSGCFLILLILIIPLSMGCFLSCYFKQQHKNPIFDEKVESKLYQIDIKGEQFKNNFDQQNQEHTQFIQKLKVFENQYQKSFLLEINALSLRKLYKRSLYEFQDFKNLFKQFNIGLNQSKVVISLNDYKNKNNRENDQEIDENILEEICEFSKITVEECKRFENILRRRIEVIEITIDYHFQTLKNFLIRNETLQHYQNRTQVKNDLLEIYDKFSYDDKVKLLIQKQEDLIEQNIRQFSNHGGKQTIMRLRGSNQMSFNQTYSFYDHHHYQIASKFYYNLQSQVHFDFDIENQRKFQSYVQQENFIQKKLQMKKKLTQTNGENQMEKRQNDSNLRKKVFNEVPEDDNEDELEGAQTDSLKGDEQFSNYERNILRD